jgi:molybdopterin molybdotransferase
VLDLVPRVLAEAGVKQVFHKVNLKPGKPLWFGEKQSAECGVRSAKCHDIAPKTPHPALPAPRSNTLVFGLPGNPVSTLVCFELFVRPALHWLAGHAETVRRPIAARLTADFAHRGNRPTYHPGRLEQHQDHVTVTPVRWQGSADLRALALANCLIHFPAGDQQYPAGSEVTVLLL